jgi:hypothetical protein
MLERPWSSRSLKDILRPTLTTNMVQWILQWGRQKRRSTFKKKRQGSMTEKYCHDNILMIFCGGGGGGEREYEDKIMVKLDFDFFQNCLF